jgi:hypothetical protein
LSGERDRNLIRYERSRWLLSRYLRRPWNLALWWRTTGEMRRLIRGMEAPRDRH